jgi:site-specific DNA recombinase
MKSSCSKSLSESASSPSSLQEDLADELYDRGVRTRATRRHPTKKVSENKISQMLRDRYYVGYVEYEGEEIRRRHEPLIVEDLRIDRAALPRADARTAVARELR